MSNTFVVDQFEIATSSIEQCLAQVRWVPRSTMQAADYKLQQLFHITDYRGGQPTGCRLEWRDVPLEHPP